MLFYFVHSQDEIQLKGEEIDDPKGIVHGTDLTIIEDEGSISDEQTVDNLAHAQAILDADEEVQYQWKSGDGGDCYFLSFTGNYFTLSLKKSQDISDQDFSSFHSQPIF